MESQVAFLDDMLKVSFLEESFNDTLLHDENAEKRKYDKIHKQMVHLLCASSNPKDTIIRQYLNYAGSQSNHSPLRKLLSILKDLVVIDNCVTAFMVCDQILICEKLTIQNKNFWCEAFTLIQDILHHLGYKEVRHIMRDCFTKMQAFPQSITSHNANQLMVIEKLLISIFDRDNCLLPAYFVANEIFNKSQPTHWKISNMMKEFKEGFKSLVQMLSIIGLTKMLPVVEHSGNTENLINAWRLESDTLKLHLKGYLPYDDEFLNPQTQLVHYVLEQPYSKDMFCSMLNLNNKPKERSAVIEEQLVWLVMSVMERAENDASLLNANGDKNKNSSNCLWICIAQHFIYFSLFQLASFPNIILTLNTKLAKTGFRKGRNHLMWALLQYMSGSISKNNLSFCFPMFDTFEILFPDNEPLPIPDTSRSSCIILFAPVCIWIHFLRKAQTESYNLNRTLPIALRKHFEYLQHAIRSPSTPLSPDNDFLLLVLCNAYSTNMEYLSRLMAIMMEKLNSTSSSIASGPFPMKMLDNVTVHVKMSIMQKYCIMKQICQSKTPGSMSSSLVETYARLLVYSEIDTLGIKGMLSQLFPVLFKNCAWGILHTILEMLSYRMHHIQPFYRMQLLSNLHSLASVPQTNQVQIHLCVESTVYRLIMGLGSFEIYPQLNQYFSESKYPNTVFSMESEEQNRILILTLARAFHITHTGNDVVPWCKETLQVIMSHTPHSWPQHTLHCFPQILQDFFNANTVPIENKVLLKKTVEEEYRNWISMSNENDIIAHFVSSTEPLFLCLVFQMILETGNLLPVSYKILERIGARGLSAHLRKLCDFLVHEVGNKRQNAEDINKCVDTINDMIWKYNIFTIDRLLLCMVLRTNEGTEAQLCFFIIQLLLLKPNEFRNRITSFVKDNSPDHWKHNNWHEKHLEFHQKYPEKFAPDETISQLPYPVYFGNVCLRFLPVLDVIIHRSLELIYTTVSQTLEAILDKLGCLYKFHDRPITYLYNTLHYYEKLLREKPLIKRRLVAAIIGSLEEIRPPKWAFSELGKLFLKNSNADQVVMFNPDLNYYIELVRRLVNTINGKEPYYVTDWRFNEFTNLPVHTLYVTCVELLSLPICPKTVSTKLIDVILTGYTIIPQDEIHSWMNALGLIFSALPEVFRAVVYDRFASLLQLMVKWPYRHTPFEMFNFNHVKQAMLDRTFVHVLAITQSMLHHSSNGQLAALPTYVKEKFLPIVKTEYQLIYVCHLIGPTLVRANLENSTVANFSCVLIYQMLEQVDKNTIGELHYTDPLVDLLYHIKYQLVGDHLRERISTHLQNLRPALQKRLKFIIPVTMDESKAQHHHATDSSGDTVMSNTQQLIKTTNQNVTNQ